MNSSLNPEAAEFYPQLTSVTKDGYLTVQKTIKSSNNLPSGQSYELFKTFTDFNSVSSRLSRNVLLQSNQIVATELPAVKLQSNDDEYNTEKIIDVNDRMLDRVNINLDTLSGVNKANDKFLDGISPSNVSSWNKQTVQIKTTQVGSTTFIGAKNIPRPQLTFKDTIDNSDSLWVPKISDKPNNIKPLALKILYSEDGVPYGYEHPYQVELDLYNPPAEFLTPDTEEPTVPASLSDTPLTFINTEAQLIELVKHLDGVKEIAVDLEHHSYRTYQGITCLIQITTNEGGDFIIDALAVREHLHLLNQTFTDPRKMKVIHGADSDVLWLQRDFGVYIVGLFDTCQAAKKLNFNGLSLKYLLQKYCSVNADKRYQLADWRIRPLPDELVEYARSDTHYLLYIWRRLKAELLEAGSNHLLQVLELSRQICLHTYSKELVDDNSHMPLYVRSKKSFNSQQMAALQILYKWRDEQARTLDESVMYLLPNHMLMSLAETLPREVQGVNAICNPMPPFVKQNLITIHRMILSCRELPMEPQLYQMPASIQQVVTAHSLVSYNVHDLTHLPDFRDDEINLDKACDFADDYPVVKPDVSAFTMQYKTKNISGIVTALNADAKLFIPPYDRYRKYRALAQVEEIKAFKDKEAKIAAICKGNEMFDMIMLDKMKQAKAKVENIQNDSNNITVTMKVGEKRKVEGKKKLVEKKQEENKIEGKKEESQAAPTRKRKISTDAVEQMDEVQENTKNVGRKAKNSKEKDVPNKGIYKSADYNKFYNEFARSAKAHKQPKIKNKKRK